MREKWEEAPRIGDNAELAKEFGVSSLTMRLIRNRAGESREEVRKYLKGTLDDLGDPLLIKGVPEAVSLILEKIRSGVHLRIIGDYDIDGVNSTYILLTALRRLGADVDTVIPDRIKDGYGVNERLIREAKEDGTDTVITCDNGIAAAGEVALARDLGMTVIVTDHHEVPYREEADGKRSYILPPADVVINPKQADSLYPFRDICGAVVVWRLVEVLYREAGVPRSEYLALLPFAGVATVGDIMDLTGENRIIAKCGLEALKDTDNKGYRALIAAVGLSGKDITSYHIGYVLGPCINASGRLDTAQRALRLLLAETDEEAVELAGDLKALNDSRKELTNTWTAEAVKRIEESDLKKDRVLVVYLNDCHESLAGIIAGRLRERYHRPAIVITDAEEGAKGSARSIPEYNMFEELSRVRELFTRFGGHPMAAGLSMLPENIEILRKRINESCNLGEDDLREKVFYDAILPISYAGDQLINELKLLEPSGKGNEQAQFAARDLKVRSADIMGKNQNVLRMVLEDEAGNTRDAVRFGNELKEELEYIKSRERISVVYYPEYNEYYGQQTLQLVIKAVR